MKLTDPTAVRPPFWPSLSGALIVAVGFTSCAASDASEPDPIGATDEGGGAAPVGAISSPVVLDDAYDFAVAYSSDVRVNGVACGDLDPQQPGDEIVAVDHLGRVYVIARIGDQFGHDEIALTGGELVQVAVGDLIPEIPGDEIVAVGVQTGTEDDEVPGVVRVFYRDEEKGWDQVSYVTPALVHAVSVGQLRGSESPAETFVCAGFFGEALVGSFVTEAGARALTMEPMPLPVKGNAKGCAMMEGGVVFAFDDGHTVLVREDELGNYQTSNQVQSKASLARVAYSPEWGVLVCDNSGFLKLYGADQFSLGRTLPNGVRSNTLERSGQRLRGAVFADMDPDADGLEACSAGYDGQIRVVRLYRDGDKLLTQKAYVARDSGKLHHLAAGTFTALGTSLVSCGYSGDVLVIHRRRSASR